VIHPWIVKANHELGTAKLTNLQLVKYDDTIALIASMQFKNG
jgi:hypothetical protein